jgi:hypothetical protein
MTENGLQTFVMGLYRAGQAGQCSHAQHAARNVCKYCPNFVKTLSALTTNTATNHSFDSNLCTAPICRNDATDLCK